MLEVYLFVNPIGKICYQAEKDLLELVSHTSQKIRFRFITLMSLKTIETVMLRHHLALDNLEARNDLSQQIYQSAIDYKAACFQGKERGCQFLLSVQKQVGVEKQPYSDAVAKKAATVAHLDWEMFSQDRNSPLAVASFHKDQKVAAEMNVTDHPTIVVCDPINDTCAFSFQGTGAIKALATYLAEKETGTDSVAGTFPLPHN
ncbi:MAG: DsbA family protein [Ligilactobacillus saerimneri]|nr:DsbA family protein [Ligilactobacillus saerimneri]